MSRLIRCAVLGLLALAPVGCGGGAKEESIPIKSTDPMAQVTSTLQAYARGQPLGSEVTKALGRMGIAHEYLPHPSHRERANYHQPYVAKLRDRLKNAI